MSLREVCCQKCVYLRMQGRKSRLSQRWHLKMLRQLFNAFQIFWRPDFCFMTQFNWICTGAGRHCAWKTARTESCKRRTSRRTKLWASDEQADRGTWYNIFWKMVEAQPRDFAAPSRSVFAIDGFSMSSIYMSRRLSLDVHRRWCMEGWSCCWKPNRNNSICFPKRRSLWDTSWAWKWHLRLYQCLPEASETTWQSTHSKPLSGVITMLWLEDEVRALVNWHIQRFHFEIGLGVFLKFSEFSLLKHFQACWAADALEQTQSSAARLWSGTGAESGLWQGGCTDQSKGRFS